MRNAGHEGPTFTKSEILAQTRLAYAQYAIELKKRDPFALPPAWEKAGPMTRKWWQVDVSQVMIGARSRNPEPWVAELVEKEVRSAP